MVYCQMIPNKNNKAHFPLSPPRSGFQKTTEPDPLRGERKMFNNPKNQNHHAELVRH